MNEMPTAERLSIGDFARQARLSPKALRLYDALGLLTPASTDPSNGYRYYTAAQLPRAHLIALLRQLGMPLTRIAGVLELPDQAAAQAISTYWREVEHDTGVKRRLVHYLETFLSGKAATMYDVQYRDVPAQKVATVQQSVLVRDLPALIDRAHRDLYTLLAAAGLPAGPRSFVIYHGRVDEESDGPVEVCVPFEGTLDPQGEVRIRLEPARREAFTTITLAQCQFPGILGAYDAVYTHARERQMQPAAPPREVYFTAQSAVQDDDPFCDVALPVRQEQART